MSFDLSSSVKRPSKKPVAIALVKPTYAQELTLFALHNRIVKLWTEASQRIVAGYAANLSEGSSNGPGDAAHEIDRTAADAQRLIILMTPAIGIWAANVERSHQVRWIKAVMAATKVDIGTVIGPSDMNAAIKAALDWNVALIKDVSAETQRRIANIVFSGFQQKKGVAYVAKEISEVTGMARRRARNIAYDQTNKLGAALNKARMAQAGIDKYRWQHSAKLHARPTHLARNGQVFPWDGPGSVAPDDQPGIPPFCGCTARAVLTFAKEPEGVS